MSLYCISQHIQDEWIHGYEHFDSDSDAKYYAGRLLGETCDTVVIYRYETEDTCGLKTFVNAYER